MTRIKKGLKGWVQVQVRSLFGDPRPGELSAVAVGDAAASGGAVPATAVPGAAKARAGACPAAARWLPLWALVALIGLAVGVRLARDWQLPLPFCWLRALTGIPCPACGCTRSLLAWAHLDPGSALRFNPLFFVGCLGVVAWATVWTLERITGIEWLPRLTRAAHRLPVRWILAGLATLNWLYLCRHLPK